MKQIVDKLNKIAKKIDESVEIPQTDLIIDSLDAITKAYGGTPNDSNLIVDKLEDIYNNIGSGGGGGDTYDIIATEQSATGEYSEPYYVATITESFTALTTDYYPSIIVDYNGTTYTLTKDEQAGGYGDFEYDSQKDSYVPVFTNNPFALYVNPGIASFGELTLISNNSFNGDIEIKAERVNPQLDLTLSLSSQGSCTVIYTDGDGTLRVTPLAHGTNTEINVLNVPNNIIMAYEFVLSPNRKGTITGSNITLSHKAEGNHSCACTFSNADENPVINIDFDTTR